MTFSAPVEEQAFLLRHVVGIGDFIGSDAFPTLNAGILDAIVAGAARFAEEEFAPLLRVGDEVGPVWSGGTVTMPDGYRDAYRSYVDNGWGGVSAPEEFGGSDLPYSLATLVLEDLSAANLGFASGPMLTYGAVEALAAHGSEAQKRKWLPRLISGEWSGTMNLTEPQAGTDVGALRTIAVPAGNGLFRIKGQKIYISFGEHDLTDNIVHLVLARLPGAPMGTKGISLFLVPKFRVDDAGNPAGSNDVQCVSIEHKLGLHASPTCTMVYGDNDDCLGELLGAENGGMAAMFTMMNAARINVGNQGVQVAERARQKACAFARERVQSARADGSSGKAPVAIVEHPDVRRMLMRMNALTQAARALLYYAAGQVDRKHIGDERARQRLELITPLVKSYCTDIGCEVASLGVQIHGGMGFVEETGAAQHYRDARILPIYEGTNGVQAADLVGRKLMNDGGHSLRDLLADIAAEAAAEPSLAMLSASVEEVVAWMLERDVNDRLAGSYPFLSMVSVLTAGWLMARQGRALRESDVAGEPATAFVSNKHAAVRYYLDCLVPEAMGLKASAMLGEAQLYRLGADELTR